ncbi:uncharacterized protein LOC116925049 [Daphnia magna]|uniref:uncharacterized protein LOC116925049 n=1 Tax=Daphnia magna TaxID=35525 RepID=UPI001403FD90|nr:uncharacterized protein LOC116925049 [Daphnia magna]
MSLTSASEKDHHMVCVLPLDEKDSKEKIFLFTESTLAMCQNAELVYRFRSQSKFRNIQVPSSPNASSGYHVKCYRKFTSVSKEEIKVASAKLDELQSATTITSPIIVQQHMQPTPLDSDNINADFRNLRSGRPPTPKTVFDQNCLFCDKTRKLNKDKVRESMAKCQTIEMKGNIEANAKLLNDTVFLGKISSIGDFIAKEVKYHRSCLIAYRDRANAEKQKKVEKEASSWQRKKDICQKALESTTAFMETKLFVFSNVLRMQDIFNHYLFTLQEFGLDESDIKKENAKKISIGEKILLPFGDRVTKFIHPTITVGKIVFKATISMDEALSTKFGTHRNSPTKIREAAFVLRNAIFKQPKKYFPSKVTVKDFIEGEIQVPPLLSEFFECLVAGHINPTKIREGKQIRIKSLCEDSIFAATNGRCKPSKHVLLSLVMKSVTGSRKAIEVLNKFGHGINYHATEELETELTYSTSDDSRLLPWGLERQNQLHTGK